MSITPELAAAITELGGLFNIKQAAAYLNISVSAIENLRREGCFPTVKMGKIVRFDRDDLDVYIGNSKVTTGDD